MHCYAVDAVAGVQGFRALISLCLGAIDRLYESTIK